MLKWTNGVLSWKPSVVVFTLLIALATALAVACSSDDGADDAAAAAAPTTAPAAPAPEEGGGTFIIANDLIGPKAFSPSLITGGAHSAFGLQDWGFYDFLIRADYSAAPVFGKAGSGGIATAWDLASDRSKITFTIRSDAEFNCAAGGKVDADDIVYSFMDSMKDGTKSTRGPGIKRWAPTWTANSDTEVVATLNEKNLAGDWLLALGNHGGGSIPIVSKDLQDSAGDGALTTPCGSGPFHITSWTSEDEVIGVPVPGNWRAPAHKMVDEFKVVQIAETNAKLAALKTGEVHMANIPLKFIGDANDDIEGSWLQMTGKYQPQIVYFGGNFWAKRAYRFEDEADIFPRPGLKADDDHPWIGNPDDPANMERARKVRWAMSMAIDRESLNKNVFNNLGVLTYTYTDVLPDHELYNPDWTVPYDVAGAKKLLAEAGFADGFDLGFWVSPDNTAAVDPEIFEAIAQQWQDVGINASIEKTVYAARRPTLVARSIDIPFAHHTFWLTKDQAKGQTLVPTGGFNHGGELPEEIGLLRYENDVEPDKQKRIENNLKMQDFLSYWQLQAVTVTLQPYWLVRPEVAEWKPHQQAWAMFNSPETVKMAK